MHPYDHFPIQTLSGILNANISNRLSFHSCMILARWSFSSAFVLNSPSIFSSQVDVRKQTTALRDLSIFILFMRYHKRSIMLINYELLRIYCRYLAVFSCTNKHPTWRLPFSMIISIMHSDWLTQGPLKF